MLNRQKALIEMLRQAERPVTKLELVKWAFVLRQETESSGGSSFYDFVPYHYGPYSFTLTREIETLVAIGYINEHEKAWELARTSSTGEMPSRKVSRDIARIIRRFGSKSVSDLIGYVYHAYPSFTVNSKREQLASRPCTEPKVYTAGYEGLQVDGFLNLLVQNGIERLLDVRRNPVARRYGFHKSTLSRLCNFINIDYEHIPELGISSDARQSLVTYADYTTLFESYQHTTLVSEWESVERVGRLIAEKPSVLVCMEADPCFCHRSRLAADVARSTGLPVIHLGAVQ